MKIEFKRLTEIPQEEVIALLNNPRVRRHMPLARELFDRVSYNSFIRDKEQLWSKYGYGPWAFVMDNKFIGWGGLQYENGDADLALVLHPDYWGLGKTLCERMIEIAFVDMHLESITALLPLSRKQSRSLTKLGFIPDGELIIDGEKFIRYRLFSQKTGIV